MRILFDIESNNYLEHMTVIHCIVTKDIDTGEVRKFRPSEIKAGLKHLQDATVLIGHNIIQFDIAAIKKLYPKWDTKAYLYDTLISAKVAYPDLKDRDFKKLRGVMNKDPKQRTEIETKRMRNIGKHSLEAYGLRMGLHKGDFGKEVGFETYSEEMLEYCVRDVEVNAKLFHRLEAENLSQDALDTEFRAQQICLDQTTKGFNFDLEKAEKLHADLLARREELSDLISEDLGGDFIMNMGIKVPKRTTQYKELLRGKYTKGAAYSKLKMKAFNPNSRSDLATRLIERCKWKPKVFGKDNKPTLSEEILDTLKYPVTTHISEYLMIDKRLGMLANGHNAWLKLYNEDTKCIHGRVNTLGAATSRCSHMKPNLAQIPAVRAPWGKECRALFIPPKGMKIYDVDLSGIELRMLAHYMFPFDQGDYAEVVVNGDVHVKNQEAAGLPTRDMAKTFIYAYAYGSGAKGLAETCNMSIKDMKKIMQNFSDNLPALSQLVSAVKGVVRTRGFVKALDSRKIYCSSEHASLNYLLQSAGAIVAKLWMVYSIEEMEKAGYKFNKDFYQVAFIHDQYDWIYDPKVITHEEMFKASQDALDRVQKDLNIKVKLDCAAASGDDFSEVH